MGIAAKIVLALGISTAGLMSYSWADTQDRLIKLDNESRGLRAQQIEEYDRAVAHLVQSCHRKYEQCDHDVLRGCSYSC